MDHQGRRRGGLLRRRCGTMTPSSAAAKRVAQPLRSPPRVRTATRKNRSSRCCSASNVRMAMPSGATARPVPGPCSVAAIQSHQKKVRDAGIDVQPGQLRQLPRPAGAARWSTRAMLRRAYSSSAKQGHGRLLRQDVHRPGRNLARGSAGPRRAAGHGKAQPQPGDRVELRQRADDDHVGRQPVRPATDSPR